MIRLRLALAAALALAVASAAAQDLPPGFVRLRDVDASIAQDMRYATTNNFTGHPLPGYAAPECILQRAAALALKRVQADLTKENLSLKVYDCYRPARAVKAMARWAADPKAVPNTQRFYPDLKKERLFALGYIAAHSAHSRGVAIDLTLIPRGSTTPRFDPDAHYGSCAGPAASRAPDDSIGMGAGYDCFDPKSFTRAGGLSTGERGHRERLLRAMARHGFVNYRREWWHFALPAADPGREFDFPIR